MDSADEWKRTSEKQTPAVFSFPRARQPTWITQLEERRHREDPLARRFVSAKQPPRHRQELPAFVQGTRPMPTAVVAVID
ncbi:hypothetical protein PINS_up016213 [Pythium insidiosum]|nr:hypothetical protein PINS_up014219 [Pythium insidiosum]GLE06728.1 hypothetical protein PINS_up016213 [Pythium insidiosum]